MKIPPLLVIQSFLSYRKYGIMHLQPQRRAANKNISAAEAAERTKAMETIVILLIMTGWTTAVFFAGSLLEQAGKLLKRRRQSLRTKPTLR